MNNPKLKILRPDLSRGTSFKKGGIIPRRASPITKYVIGIDEVGRGTLAGPVMVAAVLLSQKSLLHLGFGGQVKIKIKKLGAVKDSKKLSARQREEWVRRIKELKIPFAIARVSPAVIDRINISRAANLAAFRAFSSLTTRYTLHPTHYSIFLDGGLYLKNKTWAKDNGVSAATVIRGDEKIPAVALASIVAKVHRDRYMVGLAKEFPGYGFEVHMGYGTARHLNALRKLGPAPVHRRSFLRSSLLH